MKKLMTTTALTLAIGTGSAQAEAESCKDVTLANLGWTDILLTDATAELILESLGYDVEVKGLSLGITYTALQEGDVDVFQGNWLPVQMTSYGSFYDDGIVEVLGTNLPEAKFTLAVPSYLAEKGIKSFTDVANNHAMFDGKIYGIEPGSNDYLLRMLSDKLYGFGDNWEIVETSESGMLSQAERAIAREEPVVFLGWEPHPMNVNYDITYLEGGDEVMGANYGGSSVRTVSRAGYAAQCPNVAKFFSQLQYTIDYENYGMNRILLEGAEPIDAAKAQLLEMPKLLDGWLEGVTTFDGQPALPVVKAALGLS